MRLLPLLAVPLYALALSSVARAESLAIVAPPPAEGPRADAPRTAPKNDGLAFGFALHRFQDDFGLGGLIASPSFVGDAVRIVGGGGVAWYPHAFDAELHETWKAYGYGRLVLEGGAKLRGAPLRLYGFGGATVILPPASLATTKAFVGGVGGFGFEFRFRQPEGDGPVTYFIELGGIGVGAKAEALPGHPIFANGFLATVGLRVYPFDR